jgi:hypothetical protein
MNRHAQDKAQNKDTRTKMTNEETNTASTVAARSAHGALEKAASKKGATRKKDASKADKKVPKAARSKEADMPRGESKGAKVLALIRRPKGATLAELAKLTGWQNHSIRGYLSGTVSKKRVLTVESARRGDRERVYSISK